MDGKLVLTGITNNPGRILVEYIGQNMDQILQEFPGGVRAVVRASSNINHFKTCVPDGEIVTCDLTDRDALTSAFKDADTVFHVAGIHWSREVIDAAVANHVRRVIAIHTCGIYSKYKAAGEEYRQIDEYVYAKAKEAHIDLTILRPTMIYGNKRDRNIIKFIKMVDKLPIMPVVNGARYALQPVHYRDLGEAFYQVLVHPGTANHDYILSGAEPILLRDMLTEIGKNLGKEVHFLSCPFWIAYPGAVAVYGITLGKIDLREKVQRLCEPRAYPHEEATAAWGFAPVPFEVGIADEVREYKEEEET